MAPRQSSTLRRLVVHPAALAPTTLAIAFAVLGRTDAAVLLMVVAVVVAGVRLATGFRFDHWLATAAASVGNGLTTIIGTVGFVLVVLPVWLFRVVTRRGWRDRGSWVDRTGLASSPRQLGSSTHVPAPRRALVLRGVGLITVVLAANYLLGLVWDTVSPRPSGEEPATTPSVINVTGADLPRDARSDDPAMGGAPWAEQYFDELNAIKVTYWPFVLFRSEPYQGDYVNGEGWTRQSYTAEHPGLDEVPLLSFYGGSTTFGVGQRDGHTIASEVARIAEAEGYPVEVRNHGYPGFVSWQEQFLFEHFTAAGERPLRAVFYDGLNEVYAQRQGAVIGNPTDTEVEQMGDRIATPPVAGQRSLDGARSDDVGLDDVVALYNEHSAAARIVDGVADLFGSEPAGAAPLQDPPDPPDPTDPEDVGKAAVQVYERSRTVIGDIAERAGITPVFFWQPVPRWDDPALSYVHAVDRLTDPTIPIVECLDGHERVYLVDEHTNEEGARLVAECMWEELGPAVRSWYERNDIPKQEVPAPGSDPDGEDAPVTASELADVGLTLEDLGPGWSNEVPLPNLIDMCMGEVFDDSPERDAGPSYGLDGSDAVVRTTSSRYEYPTEADAEAAFATATDGAELRSCMERQGIENMGIEPGLTWDGPAPDPALLERGVGAWNGNGFVRFFGSDVRFEFLLVRQGRSLISHLTLGTDPARATEATQRAIPALLGR